MNHEDISKMLEQTLADDRLSRGERSALSDALDDASLSASDAAFVRNEAFRLAEDAISGDASRAADVLEWLRGIMKIMTPAEKATTATSVAFSPGDACRDHIRTLLRGARTSIDIAVFTITDDRITREIVAAHERGVRVRVITDDDKAQDLGSDAFRLEDSGIAVAYDDEGHMHHKFAIFDDRAVLNGSYNWTRAASTENHENVVVTNDATMAHEFTREFETLWKLYAR